MLIRKNTKAFKTIAEIVTTAQSRADREKLIRLYITKAGHSIKDRISVEGIQGEADLFYEMNYQAVLNSLKSSNHQLHQSDEIPGIYFFRSTSNKVWDETPFEFDEVVKNDFGNLPDFPVVRKKGKTEKFTLPTANTKSEPSTAKKEKTKAKKEKVETTKSTKIVEPRPKQPDYKLRHKIDFTDLDKIVFRQAKVTKKDVLDYYNKIASFILPYLKDRPQSIRVHPDGSRSTAYKSAKAMTENNVEVPDWVQGTSTSKNKEQTQALLCNDREHLLFYSEIGCFEYHPGHARVKSLEFPDYIIVGIESPEAALGKAIDVALAAREILSALQLPAFVKTDGASGLHIYLPLDSRSKSETSKQVAAYICRLIQLKVPDLVTLKGSENFTYGKVVLDYLINEEGSNVIAPYSLVRGESAAVATPLLWKEVQQGLEPGEFNHETIFTRLKQVGDPFESLFKKKINAETLLEKMTANYSFLF
jgi:DNA ligase D-like protein (predicted polymerase)